ncbi:glutathione S-transferase family protein [Sphingobium tyrosinilyticum]|uniref:Glutathione S-transferase family protein n=1 Tax=Sphingobium tyrosinilyticum TaxID=2715436 RepID=A0ABV9F2M8_9SPHN
MLTVHHLGISQSDRIVWLCEELGLTYQLVRHERDPLTRQAPDSYRALHPSNTAPVIEDGSVTLPETGAILDYVIAKYGGGEFVVEPDSPHFANYIYWLHFANGSFMPAQMMAMAANVLAPGQDNSGTRAFLERADRAFAMVEARLGESPYFAGPDFTLADVMMHFPLTTMRLFVPRDISALPNLRAYLARVAARPAYIRAMAKADPGFTPPLA